MDVLVSFSYSITLGSTLVKSYYVAVPVLLRLVFHFYGHACPPVCLQAWSSEILTLEKTVHGSPVGLAVGIGGCHVPAWVHTSLRASVRVLSNKFKSSTCATGYSLHRLHQESRHMPTPIVLPAGAERVFLVDILSTNTASRENLLYFEQYTLQRGGDTWTMDCQNQEPLTRRLTASNSSSTTEITIIAASSTSGTKLAALHLAHAVDDPADPCLSSSSCSTKDVCGLVVPQQTVSSPCCCPLRSLNGPLLGDLQSLALPTFAPGTREGRSRRSPRLAPRKMTSPLDHSSADGVSSLC
ncbi:uncharacterized protein LOC119374803 isoform X3 [Rhipicephalus sanguineus]|uniref:uncharacterized protein LOC119374803 isoform X3 n=1 Tax=Rhipicephalus sanguineus TaxID=34632 RepID=UPI0020C438D5|nr:uncharacterized protein LOC119374803 isoform X3 [Rhipicephalus sanguineus]